MRAKIIQPQCSPRSHATQLFKRTQHDAGYKHLHATAHRCSAVSRGRVFKVNLAAQGAHIERHFGRIRDAGTDRRRGVALVNKARVVQIYQPIVEVLCGQLAVPASARRVKWERCHVGEDSICVVVAVCCLLQRNHENERAEG